MSFCKVPAEVNFSFCFQFYFLNFLYGAVIFLRFVDLSNELTEILVSVHKSY